MNLLLSDLDGVIFNSDRRFALARARGGQKDRSIAYDPTLIKTDSLIPGADVAIHKYRANGYCIVYISGRPENTYLATFELLCEYRLDGLLICKPAGLDSATWKAGKVLEYDQSGQYEEIIFVDDYQANRDAVERLRLPRVRCLASL